jgi:hypothetical protein
MPRVHIQVNQDGGVNKKKHVDKILDALDWQLAWSEIPTMYRQTRIEDDSQFGILEVIASNDGDVWVETIPDKNEFRRSLRFREPISGGGQSARVRKALMVLAMAIKADNEESPQRRALS